MQHTLDPDIELRAGRSESGVSYVAAVVTVDGQEWFTAEELPEWMVGTFNMAARRVKDEHRKMARAAKAQAYRDANVGG